MNKVLSIFDPDVQHLDVDTKIAVALERLSQVFRVLLWEKTKTFQLSPIQVQMMVYLLYPTDPPVTMGKISRKFNITPATVTDAIKAMERKRLVVRKPLKNDRRNIEVRLTAKGRQLAGKLADWADIIRSTVARTNPEQKVVVLEFLMNLIKSLQQAGFITIANMCMSCKFFEIRQNEKEPYYCQFLEMPLSVSELRIDCPDYKTVY